MKIIKYIILIPMAFICIVGCAGNYGKLKTQSASDSKATQQELIDNWSDYNIRYSNLVIVFDPKSDDKKILGDNYWGRVKDQETWTRLVKGHERLPWGHTNQVWGNEIREIWLPDNRFYGYVTHAPNELIAAQIVDEKSVRIFHSGGVDRRNY